MSNTDTAELKCVIAEWETMRVAYNLVLLLLGGLLSYDLAGSWGVGPYLVKVSLFGIIANVFFCLAPLTEIYFFAYGIRFGKIRYMLFALGLLFSIGVVFVLAFAVGLALALGD